ncbi:hypothetical protein OG407_34555 [Streptomyces sp. NBC_01515]
MYLRGLDRTGAESATPAAERLMWLNQAIDPAVTALTGVPAKT